MLRTKAILTCDGCGKTVEEETGSVLKESHKTLCKECSGAYRKARAALTDGFMGGAK